MRLAVVLVLGAGMAFGLAAGIAMASGTAEVLGLNVDHVTVCSADLELMRTAFTSVGLASDYGGPHANGATHMALVGFADGSYLELIAPIKARVVTGSDWGEFMDGDAGPCAWAVGTSDIQRDVARLKAAGVVTHGPAAGGRKKQDGTQLRWETASVGPGPPGSQLPFLIEDKTARSLRVQPSASVKGSGLRGIALVVLGVRELEPAISGFERAYGWGRPQVELHPEWGAKLAYFAETPAVLAAPTQTESWLAKRLERFGPSPVAFLMGTGQFEPVAKRYGVTGLASWFGRRVGWFDAEKLRGVRLGVVEEQ